MGRGRAGDGVTRPSRRRSPANRLTRRNQSKPGAVYLRLPIAAHLRGLIVFVCVVPYSLGSYFRSSLAHLSCSHAYFDSYSGSPPVSLYLNPAWFPQRVINIVGIKKKRGDSSNLHTKRILLLMVLAFVLASDWEQWFVPRDYFLDIRLRRATPQMPSKVNIGITDFILKCRLEGLGVGVSLKDWCLTIHATCNCPLVFLDGMSCKTLRHENLAWLPGLISVLAMGVDCWCRDLLWFILVESSPKIFDISPKPNPPPTNSHRIQNRALPGTRQNSNLGVELSFFCFLSPDETWEIKDIPALKKGLQFLLFIISLMHVRSRACFDQSLNFPCFCIKDSISLMTSISDQLL